MTEFAIGMAVLCLLSPQGSMFSDKKKASSTKRELKVSDSEYRNQSSLLFLNQMKNPKVKSLAVQAAVEKPDPDNNISLKAKVKDIIYRKAYKSNSDGSFYEENQEYLVLESPAIARLVIASNHCRSIAVKKTKPKKNINISKKNIQNESDTNDEYDYIAIPYGEDPEAYLKKDPKLVKETSDKLMKDNQITLDKINKMQELEKVEGNIIVIRNKNGEEFRIHSRVLKALLMDDLKKDGIIIDLTKEEKVPSLKELEEKKKLRMKKKKDEKIVKEKKNNPIKVKNHKEKKIQAPIDEIDVHSLFENEITKEKESQSPIKDEKVVKKDKIKKVIMDKPYGDLNLDEKEATIIKALKLIF